MKKNHWSKKNKEEKERILKLLRSPRSELCKENMSLSALKMSNEHKKNISKSKMGHSVSEETREKIRKKLTGRKRPDEEKEKIKNTLKGRIFSEDHKNKIKAAWVIRKNKPIL